MSATSKQSVVRLLLVLCAQQSPKRRALRIEATPDEGIRKQHTQTLTSNGCRIHPCPLRPAAAIALGPAPIDAGGGCGSG